MAKINPRRTTALDNHPALKGKQSRLPDSLQAKIIGSKLKKTAKLHENKGKLLRGDQREASIRMNQSPVSGALARGAIGAGLGYGLGKLRGFSHKGAGKHALMAGLGLAGLGEAERRIRNKIFKLDGSEKVGSFLKTAGNLEGRMARRQLTEVCEMAQELLMYMSDEEDLHEWVQNKITTVHDRLSSVHSYVSYEKKNPPMMMQPQMLGASV
ncbi:MAG: hypothetical protein VXZ72_01590 [Chlamydiota bacterium]|nr:hypothetical protein [Chlamydiota bacterium]